MLTRKLWVGFAFWEVLAFMIALVFEENFSLPGGDSVTSAFVGVVLGMALLWWAAVFTIWAFIDYGRTR